MFVLFLHVYELDAYKFIDLFCVCWSSSFGERLYQELLGPSQEFLGIYQEL